MNANGMNWIRQEKRLAIYIRDGLACAYCGHGIEDGAQLTLDHTTPRNQGGGNETSNLVTCCHRCNSARGERNIEEFAVTVAEYLDHGVKGAEILEHIEDCRNRPIDVAKAKELIASRGSAARVLANFL